MDKETKVILPTMMLTTYVTRDDAPGESLEVEEYDKYEFTVKEALEYMIECGREYMFDDMILQNVNMRNMLRKLGARKLVDMLSLLVEPSESLKGCMDSFVEEWEGESLRDIDIQIIPIVSPFIVDGMVFVGLQELKDSVVRYYRRCHIIRSESMAVKPKVVPQCFVGEYSESYPTFDSYDSSDNRSYQNYIIRKHPITDDEFKAISELGRCNCCTITEETPLNYLPIVYYKGEGGFMLVAQRHIPE